MNYKYMLLANVNPATYPITVYFEDEDKLNEHIALFKEKGLIHNPYYWMSELNPPYLEPSEIRVLEFKDTIISPNKVVN